MAINKIVAPLSDNPSVFAAPVVNQLLALAIDCNHGPRVSGGYIKKGSMWNIGGSMFVADSDTAITGTRGQTTLAIKFTVSGLVATASYVSSLTGVSWNGSYQGYYDASGNMYWYEMQSGEYAFFVSSGEAFFTGNVEKEYFKWKSRRTGGIRMFFSSPYSATSVKVLINNIQVYSQTNGIVDQDFFIECNDVVSILTKTDTSITAALFVYILADSDGVSEHSAFV